MEVILTLSPANFALWWDKVKKEALKQRSQETTIFLHFLGIYILANLSSDTISLQDKTSFSAE